MNLQIDDVELFVRIATLGTLSAAARERDLAVSQVTRALARLESRCGARLVHRSTHGLSLTDEGDTFLARARELLDITAQIETEFTGKQAGPSGWVRLSLSAVLAQAVIAPSLPGLYERHPALRLDIGADDRIVDMARDGIDVAIRTGDIARETLVARPIGTLTRSLYAAPAYLERFGMPGTPDELRGHRLVTNSANPALNEWRYRVDKGRDKRSDKAHGRSGAPAEAVFEAVGQIRVDNTAAAVALVQCGAGISRILDLVARPLVASGLLVPVLPGRFDSTPVPMYAVMLRERHRLPKVRACIDYWAEWLGAG